MKSQTVDAFLAAMPPAKGAELGRVRKVILQHLPDGYEEAVQKDMIVYQVPKTAYSDTYNGHPLWLAALAAPKTHLTLHLMPVYGSKPLAARLETGFKKAGKKLKIGKACISFKSADDLALDAIGEIIAAVPMEKWIAVAKSARRP